MPTDKDQGQDQPRTTLRRSARWPIVVAALAALAAAAVVMLRLREKAREAPPPEPPVSAAAPAEGGAAPPDGAEPDPQEAARLLEAVSPSEPWRRSLAEGDAVRRTAVVIDNLAEGVSPRRQLGFLAPAKPFGVRSEGGRTVIDPASYARYDAFADAVASVDPHALATAYRALHRPLEAAYRLLGYPGASLDAVAARALRRIESAPVLDGDVAVRDEGGVYVLEDARLEALRDVDKHLLRMGPRNTRLLQRKAAELREALGLPATPPGRRAAGP